VFNLDIKSKTPSEKIFILLVDDESDFLELSEIYLKMEDPRLEIDTCIFVEDALKLLENGKYQVVVSDYQMPGMDGLEFLEVLRTQGSDIPFIMFTGRGREEVAIKALNLGADRYIQKGGDPRSQYGLLAQAIINEVSRKQAEERLYESEKKFRTVVTQSQDGIILTNEEGEIIEWNDAQVLLTQIPSSEALGQKIWDMQFQFSPSDIRSKPYYKQLKSSALKCLETGNAPWLNRLNDYLIERPDGTTRYMQQLPFGIKTQIGIMLCSIMRDITDQKRSEKEVLSTRQQLQDMLDNTPAAVYVKDLEGRYIMVNRQWRERTGLLDKEVVGKTALDLFPQYYDDVWQENEKQVLSSGQFTQFEETGRTSNRVYIATKFLLRNPEGEVYALCNSSIDITERKQAENQLQESEKKYRELVENINEVIYEVDKNGIAQYVSSPIVSILKYKPSEIIAQPFINFIHPEDKQKVLAAVQRITSGSLELNEYRLLTKSGDIRWILTSSKPVFDGQEFVGLRGVLSDITSRKQKEEELRKSEARYRRLFEKSPISLWEEDFSEAKQFIDNLRISGISDFRTYFDNHPEAVAECASLIRILDVNQATLNLYGAKTKEELLGNLDKVFTEETYPAFKEELIALAENREKITIEVQNKTLKGESIYVDLGLNILSEETKDHAMISIMDITDRKEAEEREKFLTTLLRHDLGNKIHTINGYLKLLQKDELLEEHTKMIERTMNAGTECLQLLDKVGLLREIDQKEELTKVSLDFHIKNAIKKSQGKAKEHQIEIEYEAVGFDVIGGPLLEELFHNLLENAIRHSECQKVRITSLRENGSIVVSVEDDGKGIKKEVRENLFDTTFIRKKRGIGTYIIQKIAENYEGNVTVKDSELGGARFDIKLKRS
jgi:PAS domain S-box-containing protein